MICNLVEMSKQISNAKIGEDGLVMLMSRNGTILANREYHMIGELPFGITIRTYTRRHDKVTLCTLYPFRERTILLRADTIRRKWHEYSDSHQSRKKLIKTYSKGNCRLL